MLTNRWLRDISRLNPLEKVYANGLRLILQITWHEIVTTRTKILWIGFWNCLYKTFTCYEKETFVLWQLFFLYSLHYTDFLRTMPLIYHTELMAVVTHKCAPPNGGVKARLAHIAPFPWSGRRSSLALNSNQLCCVWWTLWRLFISIIDLEFPVCNGDCSLH